MELLGRVHSALKESHPALARELLMAKDGLDFRCSSATLASSGDEDVYVAKGSGRRWSKANPPPKPCFRCSQMHWSDQCPRRKNGNSSDGSSPPTSFTRGQPPARYYMSKSGLWYDTSRRPMTACQKCDRFHWWFACPRGEKEVTLPRGCRFSDRPEGPIKNLATSRTKPRKSPNVTSGSSASASDSEFEDPVSVKRTRHQNPEPQFQWPSPPYPWFNPAFPSPSSQPPSAHQHFHHLQHHQQHPPHQHLHMHQTPASADYTPYNYPPQPGIPSPSAGH